MSPSSGASNRAPPQRAGVIEYWSGCSLGPNSHLLVRRKLCANMRWPAHPFTVRTAGLVPARSRSFRFLSLLVALMLSGCQWPQSMLEGNADLEIDIPSSDITKILSVTKQLMQTNGYQATTDMRNQEVPFVAAHMVGQTNRVLCFSNRGRNRIWIIAQPIGYGWHLYCLPEPEGNDTTFGRRRLQRILQSVSRRVQLASALTEKSSVGAKSLQLPVQRSQPAPLARSDTEVIERRPPRSDGNYMRDRQHTVIVIANDASPARKQCNRCLPQALYNLFVAQHPGR